MNIAIFASAFHPHFGGVEELCRQLAHEYLRRGEGVIVVTNRWPRDLPAFEEFEGIPIYRVAMRAPDGNLKAKVNYRLTNAAIRSEVAKILQERRIDLIHVQCVSSNGFYALDAAQRLSLPLVVTLQGELTMDASGLYQRSEFARQGLRDVMTHADKVTACSQKTLDDGQEFFGQSLGERGAVVFNGASIEDFDGGEIYQHQRPYLFALGRVVPQKGFDVLLRAFATAKCQEHDLIIAGDGTERAALEALTTELGLESRVLFTGRADHAKTVSLFRGASFFVLPSRADEGLPVVCAEALAAGKATVATRSGGAPEAILHDQTGLIVEKEDAVGLSAAISQLCQDAEMRERFGKAAKARSKLFSWPHIGEQYLDIYRGVLVQQKAA